MIARRAPFLGLAMLLVSVTAGSAQEVEVTGRVVRPVWWDDVGARLRDDLMLANPDTIAATFQAVNIFQPGDFHPIYCGTLVTDATGTFEGSVQCGGVLPHELYVEVQGISARGFTVGTFDEDGFYAAIVASVISGGLTIGLAGGVMSAISDLDDPPEVFVWSAFDQRIDLADGQTSVDFGTLEIGGGSGNPSPNEDWAAAVMEGVDFAYRHLNPLGFAPGIAAPPPAFTGWVINNPFFGPTTVWTTVHLNQPRQDPNGVVNGWEVSMSALAHELGHAIYNIRHSDETHYLLDDALNYLRNHQPCQAWSQYNDAFAHYEGFAHAIRAIVWRDHAIDRGRPGGYQPLFGCQGNGLIDEGEVSDLYVQLYLGTGDQRTAANLKAPEAVVFGADTLGVPGVSFLLQMVAEAGRAAHTPLELWNIHLTDACDQDAAGVPLYCGSDRYRCWAADEAADPGDLPREFYGPCEPPASEITGVVSSPTTPGTTNTVVSFTPVANVDTYELYVTPVPTTPLGAAPAWTSLGPLPASAALSVCQTSYLWIRTVNAYGSTVGDPWPATPLDAGGCLPAQSNVTSVEPRPMMLLCATMDTDQGSSLEPAVPRPGEDPGTSTSGGPSPLGPDASDDEPGPPSLQSALQNIAESSFYKVSYTTDPTARSHRVRYSTEADDPFAESTTWWSSSATAMVVALEPGNLYHLRVDSRNEFGQVTGPEVTYRAPDGTTGCFDRSTGRFRSPS